MVWKTFQDPTAVNLLSISLLLPYNSHESSLLHPMTWSLHTNHYLFLPCHSPLRETPFHHPGLDIDVSLGKISLIP
jgi:hypothetical protein